MMLKLGANQNTMIREQQRVTPNPQQLRVVLDRERRRADRHDHQFSFVLFESTDAQLHAAAFQQLVAVLTHRLRSTDEFGWFDQRHVGVVLPYTSADGAQKLAGDICQLLFDKRLSYTIYTYPSHWFCREEENHDNRRLISQAQ